MACLFLGATAIAVLILPVAMIGIAATLIGGWF
jgi:hypothetical protein